MPISHLLFPPPSSPSTTNATTEHLSSSIFWHVYFYGWCRHHQFFPILSFSPPPFRFFSFSFVWSKFFLFPIISHRSVYNVNRLVGDGCCTPTVWLVIRFYLYLFLINFSTILAVLFIILNELGRNETLREKKWGRKEQPRNDGEWWPGTDFQSSPSRHLPEKIKYKSFFFFLGGLFFVDGLRLIGPPLEKWSVRQNRLKQILLLSNQKIWSSKKREKHSWTQKQIYMLSFVVDMMCTDWERES